MKEKIIEILKSHSYYHTEGVGVKSQFKYLAEIAFECCADEIMLALDQSQFTADEAEEHINQEVERRIAERMPSDEEIGRAFTSEHYHWEKGRYYKVRKDRIFGAKWLRSRLTCSEKPNNLKTEGGGE